LDEVSTTRGSGWVRSPQAGWCCHRKVSATLALTRWLNVASWLRTHPLPRVVLTSSKFDCW